MCYKKFVYAFVLILILSTNMFAQYPFKTGIYTVTGSVGFSLSNHEDNYIKDKMTAISIQPSFGYFVTNNLLVSGQLAFNYTEDNISNKSNGPSYKGIYRYYQVGASLRYYFNSETVIPFFGVGVFYSKQYNAEMDGKGMNISAGINYFLSKEIALEPYLSYSFSSYNKYGQSNNNFNVGLSINYYIIN